MIWCETYRSMHFADLRFFLINFAQVISLNCINVILIGLIWIVWKWIFFVVIKFKFDSIKWFDWNDFKFYWFVLKFNDCWFFLILTNCTIFVMCLHDLQRFSKTSELTKLTQNRVSRSSKIYYVCWKHCLFDAKQ